MDREDIKQLLPKEHQIQTLLKNYLQAKGWYVMRLNSGMIPMTDYRGRTRKIMMGEAGTPDLMAFKDRHVIMDGYLGKPTFNKLDLLFIEVKRPGKKPTFNQIQKMKELTEKGARCIVASSIEDLLAQGV